MGDVRNQPLAEPRPQGAGWRRISSHVPQTPTQQGSGPSRMARGNEAGSSTRYNLASPMPTNRLAQEKSPYLLQHAHNPVDWYPWGAEAFAKAARENKPIFLSVGYSTCHWCHVMERESFESEEIASVLNQHFV